MRRSITPSAAHAGKLGLSPLCLLELRLLEESGRGRFPITRPLAAARADKRFRIDEPPLSDLIERSLELGWARDPFDRLLVAHALCRGWPIATSDATLIEHLPARSVIAL